MMYRSTRSTGTTIYWMMKEIYPSREKRLREAAAGTTTKTPEASDCAAELEEA